MFSWFTAHRSQVNSGIIGGKTVMGKFDSVMAKCAAGSSFLASIWIFLIMIFICVDVVFRVLLRNPIVGTPEIVQNSLAAIAFLMMPWATNQGQHVRSTMFRDRMSPKGGCVLDIASFAVGAALFAAIIYASFRPAVFATSIGDFQGEGLRVPIYPVWWVIIFGSALSCYQCLSKVVGAFLLLCGSKNIESLRKHGEVRI